MRLSATILSRPVPPVPFILRNETGFFEGPRDCSNPVCMTYVCQGAKTVNSTFLPRSPVHLTRSHVADVTQVGGSGNEFPSSAGGGGADRGRGRRRRRLWDLREHLKAFAGAEVGDVVEVHRGGYQLLAIGARTSIWTFVSCAKEENEGKGEEDDSKFCFFFQP